MSNKTKAIINLMCAIIWLVTGVIYLVDNNIIVGIIDIFLCLMFLFIFAMSLEYKKDNEESDYMLEIERYTYTKKKDKYLVYLIENEDDENITDFYIQKKESGIISHAVGLNIDDLEIEIDEFIENNLDEWIKICLSDIEKLES